VPSKGLARHSEIHTYSISEKKLGEKEERSKKELDIIAQTNYYKLFFLQFFSHYWV